VFPCPRLIHLSIVLSRRFDVQYLMFRRGRARSPPGVTIRTYQRAQNRGAWPLFSYGLHSCTGSQRPAAARYRYDLRMVATGPFITVSSVTLRRHHHSSQKDSYDQITRNIFVIHALFVFLLRDDAHADGRLHRERVCMQHSSRSSKRGLCVGQR
jgi:hypothetical protein